MSCQAAQHTPSPAVPGAGAGFATGRGIRLYRLPEAAAEQPLPQGVALSVSFFFLGTLIVVIFFRTSLNGLLSFFLSVLLKNKQTALGLLLSIFM